MSKDEKTPEEAQNEVIDFLYAMMSNLDDFTENLKQARNPKNTILFMGSYPDETDDNRTVYFNTCFATVDQMGKLVADHVLDRIPADRHQDFFQSLQSYYNKGIDQITKKN